MLHTPLCHAPDPAACLTLRRGANMTEFGYRISAGRTGTSAELEAVSIESHGSRLFTATQKLHRYVGVPKAC